MDSSFSRLTLSDPNMNDEQRFGIYPGQYNMQILQHTNLTPNAAEFIPNSRSDDVSTRRNEDVNDRQKQDGTNAQGNDERSKGAIRKQYTNGFNRNRRYNNHNGYRQYRDREYHEPYYNNGNRKNEETECFFQDNYNQRRFHRGNRDFYTNQGDHHKKDRNDYKFKQYKQNKVPANRPPPKLDSSKCSQREKLTKEIENFTLECLVCCENIKPSQPAWSCSNCYHILHLNCIIKWATSSKSDDGWRCPACNAFRDKVPKEYYCFCGKNRNPQYNRNDTAHSCGNVCGRNCEQGQHNCTMLCHPGPCNPCQATITKYCHCKKTSKSVQCCQKVEVSCEEICGKLLNCMLHTCDKTCHAGECDSCETKIKHTCMCGNTEREVACTPENNEIQVFQCENVCDKLLTCGNHRCKEQCHQVPCKLCPLSPDFITSCPCGKMPIMPGERKFCTDEISLCKGTCKKPLTCGPPSNPHSCVSKCHTGDCSPCNKSTKVKCRCGHMDQEIKCKNLTSRADDARCKKRCTKMKSCGRHKCNTDCCIDIDHVCMQICNKMLTCRKHR